MASNNPDANNIVSKKSTATKAALNNRREMCYANEITGKGHDGNLSMKIKLAYTAPTMSTLPIIVLLAVYMNVYYEKLGASLTYIRYVFFLIHLRRGLGPRFPEGLFFLELLFFVFFNCCN